MDTKQQTEALAEPFPPEDVGWKPQTVKGNRALASAYIDARDVMERLDNVLGSDNWQDEYDCLPDGSVVCRLKLRFGGEWVTKMDVGSPSEQPDAGDRTKAAFSDALKRAAVKFGIGRYLYRLPSQWADYDPVKKQFVQNPRLPDWAIPKPKTAAKQAQAAKPEQQTNQPPPPKQEPKPETKPAFRQLTLERILTTWHDDGFSRRVTNAEALVKTLNWLNAQLPGCATGYASGEVDDWLWQEMGWAAETELEKLAPAAFPAAAAKLSEFLAMQKPARATTATA